jgi:hypothetical protein
MSRRMSHLTRIKIMKRHGEKLKERNRELREEVAFWKERANVLGHLNTVQQELIRRRNERLIVAESTIDRYRADRPKYPCGKKPSVPPLAHKYPSSLVVSGD